MARPRSDDKRSAILAAAVSVIAEQGLGAATAAIAREAGVSNGSFFTYFVTKADLLNVLYVALKTESGVAAVKGLPRKGDLQQQLRAMCTHWLRWAASAPDKRRVIAQLAVSDEITPASRQSARQSMSGMTELFERCRKNGVMRDAPIGLVVTMMTAVADATVDFMISDPAHAEQHCALACDAMWHLLN